ncbi:cell wall integrity and stress response component 2-like isoform X2 [Archocentrus centrarchus]|uniref:cell wall integrity and stress response component 2-like isoform X2 n=1 Tax=Archocentrus centrarchus TaxID=63155 RepID=UPI0011E9BF86|nr:cell wall integrity and stress response component 2-like isoform X2 [Archocentrus centrarchus]
MAEFRLFKICLFLMLPFTVTQQYTQLAAEVGGEVTLLCENGCSSITWLFGDSRRGTTVTLFEYQQINKEVGSKSDRLSVTGNCSLVIKKVTAEDEGRYTCRQFRSGENFTDSGVHLSVINRENTTTTTSADMPNSKSATPTTTATKSSTTRTDTSSAKTKSSMTSKTKSATEGANSTSTVLTKTTLISLAVGFAVLFIIMAVIGWRRVKRNKTQTSDEIELNSDYCTIPDIQDRAHPAAGVSYASINKTNNKTRVHNKYHKGDLWARISTKSARDLSEDNIYVNMRPK